MLLKPMLLWFVTSTIAMVSSLVTTGAEMAPHIIFIVADDLGWNDVEWHNPRMKTPELARLARSGIILNSSYVQQVCTPSRNCFMTGYYPIHTGLQHGVIRPKSRGHVPLSFKMLPQELKKLGYATHMVGKWHLGDCNVKYLPTSRGFDTFLGFYCGSEDYYTHKSESAYDFRWNTTVYYPPPGEYSTVTFAERAIDIISSHNSTNNPLFLYLAFQSVHGPLQVPKKYENIYENITNKNRRIHNGMVSALDEAIKNITGALTTHGYMDNTLIVFTSDNGGPIQEGSNNWPLRGSKGTLWEGGTRVVGFVYSKTLLNRTSYTSNDLIHAVDWFPTFIAAAGGTPDEEMDGINQWPHFSQGQNSSRSTFLYNIDDIKNNSGIRVGKYKLLKGNPGIKNLWYPEPGNDENNDAGTQNLLPDEDIYLFDLEADPLEKYNLASKEQEVVAKLHEKLLDYRKTMVSIQEFPDGKPKNDDGIWSIDWCD